MAIYRTSPPEYTEKVFLNLINLQDPKETILFFADMISNNTNSKENRVVYDRDLIITELQSSDYETMIALFDKHFGDYIDIYTSEI